MAGEVKPITWWSKADLASPTFTVSLKGDRSRLCRALVERIKELGPLKLGWREDDPKLYLAHDKVNGYIAGRESVFITQALLKNGVADGTVKITQHGDVYVMSLEGTPVVEFEPDRVPPSVDDDEPAYVMPDLSRCDELTKQFAPQLVESLKKGPVKLNDLKEMCRRAHLDKAILGRCKVALGDLIVETIDTSEVNPVKVWSLRVSK